MPACRRSRLSGKPLGLRAWERNVRVVGHELGKRCRDGWYRIAGDRGVPQLHSPTPEQLFAADLPMIQLILNHVSKICPWS